MERVSDDILDTFLEWLEPGAGAFEGIGRAQQASMRKLLTELKQRRIQVCATCAAWEPFSDDPVFSADEDLWCAELERHKPAAGYCDCWQAKGADDASQC